MHDNFRAYCHGCNTHVHRSDRNCPNCGLEIKYWKCGSCGNMLSKSEDRCHQYHANAYDSQGSNFQFPSNALNPWKY